MPLKNRPKREGSKLATATVILLLTSVGFITGIVTVSYDPDIVGSAMALRVIIFWPIAIVVLYFCLKSAMK